MSDYNLQPQDVERAAAELERLLHEPQPRREALLREALANSAPLRRWLRDLLHGAVLARAEAMGAHAAPPPRATDSSFSLDVRDLPRPPEPRVLPRQIGKYRVLRLLGEGGMGVIYLAEQENPRRTVALKMIRPGCASASAIRRFEREAQVLGLLHHPGIAQIYEAGTADAGHGPQAYFAMEYIEGRPLLDYAWLNRLDAAQRLELLARVCEAVHHAHERGVIHRDLKPDNILVTAEGQPKVLDFGVARLTDSDIQATTMHTEAGAFLGTMAYMSPEQVAANSKEIDARSDVYGLGVVGYQLLADRMPYDLFGKTIFDAARTIREGEPTRLGTVNRKLRGDIETILLKALEKEKERRYRTAADMAEDIRRHLRDQPILARPPGTLYQLAKFARRNKPLVISLAVVFLALAAGTAVSTTFAVREAHARGEAELRRGQAEASAEQALAAEKKASREAERAAAITRFLLDDVINAADASRQGHRVTVVDALSQAVGRIEARFGSNPALHATVLHAVGGMYEGLGDMREAGEHYDRAARLFAESLGEDDRQTILARLSGAAMRQQQGDAGGALARLEPLAAQCARVLGDDDPVTLDALGGVGAALQACARHAEAEPLLRRVVDRRLELFGDHDRSVYSVMSQLVACLTQQGKFEEALHYARIQVDGVRKVWGGEHPDNVAVLLQLAQALDRTGQVEEAFRVSSESLDLARRAMPPTHLSVAFVLANHARRLERMGRVDEAGDMLREAVEIATKQLGATHWQVGRFRALLRGTLRTRADWPALEAALREELALLGAASPDGDSEATVRARFELARLLVERERFEEALEQLASLDAPSRRLLTEGDAQHAETALLIGKCLRATNRSSEAEAALARAHQHAIRFEHAATAAAAAAALADLYAALGREEQAAQWRAASTPATPAAPRPSP